MDLYLSNVIEITDAPAVGKKLARVSQQHPPIVEHRLGVLM